MMTTNRLAAASSAYLRSTSHQPIHWYEFGDDAFAQAKASDKPILLDIGAVWCHWCHVIDRESYENPEIAALINEHFIPVKVDRDERPDVDARYQSVVSAMTGRGGWPLTAFLTHEGNVFYGGTYFPPQAMKQLLTQIPTVYRERREEILAEESRNRQQLLAALKAPESTTYTVTAGFYEAIVKASRNALDTTHGGFGSAPKFPHFSTLQLLTLVAGLQPDGEAAETLKQSLRAMANGGVYDHLEGGFHRYSVDEAWHVPHFEKMAYDNAEALLVYSQAARLFEDEQFQQIATQTMDWVLRDLAHPDGGYGASQDADINLDDDGDHFTWTLAEVQACLTPAEAALTSRYYDVTPAGDMHERPGRNVLWTPRSLESVAQTLGLNLADTQVLLTSSRHKLRAERATRPIPFIDKTRYTSWTAMLIFGMLTAANLLNHPEAATHTLLSLDWLLANRWHPESDKVHHSDTVEGTLEDSAWLLLATLDGYRYSLNHAYLQAAEALGPHLLNQFEDPDYGGFFDRPRSASSTLALLNMPRKPIEDTPSSSANAIAIQALNQLYVLSGNDELRRAVERALNSHCQQTRQHGIYVSALGVAVFQNVHPVVKVSVHPDSSADLLDGLKQHWFPGLLCHVDPQVPLGHFLPCIRNRCLQPVDTVNKLLSTLAQNFDHFLTIPSN